MDRLFAPLLLTMATIPWSIGMAQILVDAPILLQGATPADMQVLGLAPSTSPTDALTAHVDQTGQHRLGTATAGTIWDITVPGAMTTPSAGMHLVVPVPDNVTGNILVRVNGHGPFTVSYGPSGPLPSDEFHTGDLLSLVFDGTLFQLLDAPIHRPRPCPLGTVAVSTHTCIAMNEHPAGAMSFFEAIDTCAANGLRLCFWGEWISACTNAAALGLVALYNNHEWTDDSSNEDGYVRTVGGSSSCYYAQQRSAIGFAGNVRCCYSR